MATSRDPRVMPISGHAMELRSRATRAVASVIVAGIAGWFLVPSLVELASIGVGRLISVSPAETLTTYLSTALGIGVVVASPVVIYQIWAFILPGLVPDEERFFRRYFPWLAVLFLLGVGFVSKWLYPGLMRNLLAAWSGLPAAVTVGQLMSFYVMLHLAFGAIFDMPVVMMFLVHSGLIRLKDLLKARKVLYMAAFVLAAIITPPDAASQLLVAAPIVAMIELGMVLARLVWRPRRPPAAQG